MRIECCFIAVYAGEFDRMMFIQGGLPGSWLVDSTPRPVELTVVTIMDLTDEPWEIEAPSMPIQIEVLAPDGTKADVEVRTRPAPVKVGYQAFIYAPVLIKQATAGRYTVRVSGADASNTARTQVDIVDMSPDN